MKIKLETKHLAAGLKTVSVAVDRRSTLPILGNVKIEARENNVILSTTNLDLAVSITLPAKVTKEGATTLPFSILDKLAGRLRALDTKLEVTGKVLKIESGETSATLEMLPANEFPPPPPQNRTNAITCDASDLMTPLEKVHHAMSKDESRYHLKGVNLRGNEFVATDGRRIAIYTGKKLTDDSVIISDSFVRAILAIAPTGEIETVVADGLISVKAATVEILAKLIEAKYPNWKTAIPAPGKELFGCGRTELIEAIKTCAVFHDGLIQGIEITGAGKEIAITNGERVKVLVLGTELAGQPKLTKRVNSVYILDTLNVLEKDNVTIQCSADDPSLVIEEESFKTIVQGLVHVAAK